ncbi:MAG: 4Fe-4S dicluster domain-containing protein [Acetobacteraceae bacterium]|nr:4Fe-4S dicluster domain-containing protein [Acetobacteraceae bacterium]
MLSQVFPSLAGAMARPERRTLLKLMAASLALAGCDPAAPGTKWIPAVTAPPGIVPGLPNRYATATLSGGAALGLVVTHDSGRPIKVEGNPLHPASLGATDALAQALILDLYDPDRSVGLLRGGYPAGEGRFQAELVGARERLAASHGAGLRILTGTCLSPSLGMAIDRVLARYPAAGWHQAEVATRDNVRAGAALAYGKPLELAPRGAAADVIVGLDSDLAGGAPGWIRAARDVASRRNPVMGPPNRIIAIEAVPSQFGAIADTRVPAGPADMHGAITALAGSILGGASPAGPPWLAPVVAALQAARGRALIHGGPELPAEAHALIFAMNEALGGRGHTYELLDVPDYRAADHGSSIAALVADMGAGRVDTLLILDANPVFTVPDFAAALRQVPLSIQAGPAPNETALAASWHVPAAHAFEMWGDLRAHDGTVSIVQPQALPLYGGRNPLDVLALLLPDPATTPLEQLRANWRDRLPDDAAWFAALADGVVPGTEFKPLDLALRPEAARAAPPAPASQPITVLFRPDPYLQDGRHANNPWLQELPRPFTKLTWENPLLVSPALARQYKLSDGDVVSLAIGPIAIELPTMELPGLAPDVAVATLGYGRARAGEVGTDVGWDLYPLSAATGPVTLRRTGENRPLAVTGREGGGWAEHADIVRTLALDEFRADPAKAREHTPDDSLYRVVPKAAVAWGMSVDLNACIGCNACVVACMAENNVPVVGRDNVLKQREMHWLRIDRYWDGTPDTAQAALQPMLCMHCEEAPCETVCPVEASVHDSEGLNLQVYNRCVGTRFCSNNCPYKVRRFNFGPYARDEHRPPIARNPDVTVRARGVMEKCTFCVQRIAQARILHDRDGVPEQAVTACQAACPTQVFSFGDLNDKASDVSRRKQSPLDYALLPDQQTHPRLTYEARVRNPVSAT